MQTKNNQFIVPKSSLDASQIKVKSKMIHLELREFTEQYTVKP